MKRKHHETVNADTAKGATKVSHDDEANMAKARITQNLEELMVCPISLERMRDPVQLVQSGITYDREHLCQSLLRFPTKDPKSNVSYDVPLEYAPNYNTRAMLTALHGDEAFEEFNDSSFKAEYSQVWEKAMLKRLESGALPFETVRLLAERGHAIAQYELGVAYDDSLTENYKGAVDKDFDVAKSWYRKAAEQEHVGAQYNLGQMYFWGKEGVEEPNRKLAVHWYCKAAGHGHTSSQFNLGITYEKGMGIEQSHKKAVEFWHEAAKQGHAKAQNNLGNAYRNGKGVKQNCELAVEWWRKAAEQDVSKAQCSLGYAYEVGMGGLRQNLALALEWYQKAADQGETLAKEKVDALSFELGGDN